MNKFKYSLITILVLSVCLALSAQACTITIDELALWSGGSITTGNNVTVTGTMASASGVSLNSGSSVGSIYTLGGIWLGNGVTVSGDAVAKGTVTTAKSAVITGSSSGNTSFTLPGLDYLTQTAIGTTSIYAAANSSTTLSPGTYSSWSLSNGTTINLSSGSYSLSSLWIGSSSVVNIDTSAGDVILNVVGSFSVSSGVTFVTSGSGTLYINVFNSSVWLDNSVSLTGVISVFGGGLSTGSSVSLTGSVYATGNIYLGNDTSVTYVAFTNIPEPASLIMFGAAGFILTVRSRRASTNTSSAV